MKQPVIMLGFFLAICKTYQSTSQLFWRIVRFRIVKQRAERGFADAQAILGAMYSTGLGVARDYSEAFKWYYKAANQGHTSAQLIVGVRYALGIGVVQSHIKAFRWYYQAASQNNTKAQMALGLMYANGTGVSKNEIRASQWFSLALSGGSAKCGSQIDPFKLCASDDNSSLEEV